MLTFPSEPHHVRHPRRKLLVWPRRAPKINFLVRSLNLNFAFFQIPKILSASGHDFIPILGSISYLGFLLWHLWLLHLPCLRVNTCTQLTHTLTTPSRKVLSLTKLKGKIYKMKSDNIKEISPQLYYNTVKHPTNQPTISILYVNVREHYWKQAISLSMGMDPGLKVMNGRLYSFKSSRTWTIPSDTISVISWTGGVLSLFKWWSWYISCLAHREN